MYKLIIVPCKNNFYCVILETAAVELKRPIRLF